MAKDKQPERHAAQPCSCDKCWKPSPEGERKAAEFWQALYERRGWQKDELGYLVG